MRVHGQEKIREQIALYIKQLKEGRQHHAAISYFQVFVIMCENATEIYAISASFYLFGKGGYVFGSVGLSVCLFVCLWTTLLKKL